MSTTRQRDADAIRYVVLRRLSAGMRHALMGELQAIQFAAELAARMVDSDACGSRLSDGIQQIVEQTKAATRTSRSIIEWLRPEDGSRTEIEAATQECLKLAGNVWILRGIKATTNYKTNGATVAKAAFFELMVGSLLALTDLNPGPLDIDVVAEQVGGKIVVVLSAQPAERRSALQSVLYRGLTFDDVTVLAEEHGIGCSCDGTTVRLDFSVCTA
jgi:hypothetical protein